MARGPRDTPRHRDFALLVKAKRSTTGTVIAAAFDSVHLEYASRLGTRCVQ